MLALLLVVLAGVLWLLPVQLSLEFRQHAGQANLGMQGRLFLLKVGRSVNLSDEAAKVFDHVLTRWQATGEPVKIPLQKTANRMPKAKLFEALEKPARYLGRRTICTRLAVAVEIGGWDAAQSALLTAGCWTVVGTAIGLLSQAIRVRPQTPEVQVLPNFKTAILRTHVSCIVRTRLGYATVAGVWLIKRMLREKELLKWMWDSWRRKGDEESGRASDSESDEDSHG